MRKIHTFFFCLILSISATHLQAQICWSPLGSGINGYVYAMTNYDGNLIAAGVFDTAGGIQANNIASWNGSQWSTLGSGLTWDTARRQTVFVSALAVYNGELYAAGSFDTAGGVPVNNIAKWNGTSWSAVGSGIPGPSYTVRPLTVYDGQLYAGGQFDTAGGLPVHNIARWNGSVWSDVAGGIRSYKVNSLFSSNNWLYVGGSFDSAGTIAANNIAIWNDTSWQALGAGIGNEFNYTYNVTTIAAYQGAIYASAISLGGPFDVDSLYQWDGNQWNTLIGVDINTIINGVNYVGIGINSFFNLNGVLITGGSFSAVNGDTSEGLAKWDGANWSGFGGGVSDTYFPEVDALLGYNGYLYAAGNFTNIGNDSISANSIAEYTCATDGIHEVSADHVHVYPNPSAGMINISIDNAEAGSSVQIYDLLGQKVCQSNINSDNTIINLSGHAPGSYLYHISGGSGESISAGTLIIQ